MPSPPSWMTIKTLSVTVCLAGMVHAAPEIASIQPDEWYRNESVSITDLAGAYFDSAAQVYLVRAGQPNIDATNVVVVSPNQITCDIELEGAEVGLWDVVVENPGNQTDTLHSGFEVLPGFWQDDVRLTNLTGPSNTSKPNARCIAVDGGDNLHVVWFDEYEEPLIPGIYYKAYDGATWSSITKVNDSSDETFYPSIAVDPLDHLHVVWGDYRHGSFSEIYYKEFDVTWGPDTRLTDIPEHSAFPSIAAQGDKLHVVWEDLRMGNWEIYYRRYDGMSWEPEERLSTTPGNSLMPVVAVDTGGRVHVAWFEADSSIYHAMFDGEAWSPSVAIDGGPDAGGGPSMCSDTYGGVHITWPAIPVGESNLEIHYRHYNGFSWNPVERLTDDSARSSNASVAADALGIVHVIWSDNRDGNDEIYYTSSDGSGWEPESRVTHHAGESRRASAATDSEGNVHIIWQDDRDGNNEIYYRVRNAGFISGIDEESQVDGHALVLRIAPNPIQSSAQVGLRLMKPAPTTLAVYDISGRLIWRRELGIRRPGLHQVAWDGCDLHGRLVANGVYLVRAIVGETEASAKMVILR